VFVSDFGKIKDKYKQVLTNYGIWRMMKTTEALILNADVVMKSLAFLKSYIVKKKREFHLRN
jgi:UDP-N-acetylmuramoylalanine--D-glutamate ligase